MNDFKRRLLAREPLLGMWSGFCSPVAVEILSRSNLDWVGIDCEHTPNELSDVLSQVRASHYGSIAPVVRPPWNDMVTIKRYLDIGVQNFLIPHIDTAEEARAAVSYTRYPKAGVRGFGGSTRASGYGRNPAYAQGANDDICIIAMVETLKGLGNLKAIMETDGIDCILVGSADLAADMGLLGGRKSAEVRNHVESAIRAVAGIGKAAGCGAADEPDARRFAELGATFFILGQDTGMLAKLVDQQAARFDFLKSVSA